MADITITASATVPISGTITRQFNFGTGTNGTAGQVVYLDDTTMTWKIADANDTLAASGGVNGRVGFLLHGAATGQPAAVLEVGDLQFSAALTAGEVYVLSSTLGRFAPVADLTTGMYSVVLGVALSTTVMRVNPIVSGVLR